MPGLLTTPADKLPKDVTGSEEASPQGLSEPTTVPSPPLQEEEPVAVF